MSRFWVLFKSTAVRLSALYILLFAICAATLVFYVTAMSQRLLTSQIRESVQQEVDQVSAPTSRRHEPACCARWSAARASRVPISTS
jgi:hypothetical protein